jgi:hypothetical protein
MRKPYNGHSGVVRAFGEDGTLGIRLIVTIRSATKEERTEFRDFCRLVALTRRGQWSGREVSAWEVVGSADAIAACKLHVLSWEYPTAGYVHETGCGGGADTTAAKRKTAIRQRWREIKPHRDKQAFLLAVYGPDSASWPKDLVEYPPEYELWRMPADTPAEKARKNKLLLTFFLAAHLEYVRCLRDAAETESEMRRWLRAERMVQDWKTPLDMPVGKPAPKKKAQGSAGSVPREDSLSTEAAMVAAGIVRP